MVSLAFSSETGSILSDRTLKGVSNAPTLRHLPREESVENGLSNCGFSEKVEGNKEAERRSHDAHELERVR